MLYETVYYSQIHYYFITNYFIKTVVIVVHIETQQIGTFTIRHLFRIIQKEHCYKTF